MNRRHFIAAGTVTAFVPFLAGCTVTPAQVAADGEAINTALIAIGVVYPAAAVKLDAAGAAIVAATQNWTTGSTTALINDAAQAAEAVLAAIPQTATVALLIPIAIAAIDILINSIPPPPVSVSNAHIPFNAAHQNPYKLSLADQKKLITHQMLRSPAGDFKAAWNKVVAEHPELAGARLR